MKRRIVVIALIWVSALTLTFFIAEKVKGKDDFKTNLKKSDKQFVLKGISLYDHYEENDLKITDITPDKNKQDNYIQISGLKDEKVQKQINLKIKNKFNEYNTKYGKDKKIIIETSITANFGDLISLNMTVSKDDSDSDSGYTTLQSMYYNISLKDGKDIKFEDIFTNKDIINSILTKTFINDISFDINNSDISKEEKNQKMAELEDLVFSIIWNINNSDNVSFSLYNDAINVIYQNYEALIKIEDYGMYFAYPTRYKTSESLYKEDFNKLVLSYVEDYKEEELTYAKLDYDDENNFVDAISYVGVYGDDLKKFSRDSMIKHVDVEKIIADEKKKLNPKEFNYINFDGMFNVYDRDLLEYAYEINICELSKDYFENNIKRTIFLQKMNFKGAIDNTVYFDDNQNIKCQNKNYFLVFDKNYKQIKTLKDIFKDGYDYQKVIDKSFYEMAYLSNKNPDVIRDKLTYQITGNGLIYSYGDFIFTVDYEDFDSRGLKI